MLELADYLFFRADLGFYSEPAAPPAEAMSVFGCDDEEHLTATVQMVREAFDAENALFQAA